MDEVAIRGDTNMDKSGWLIDVIGVRRKDDGRLHKVPVHTVIKPGKKYNFPVNDVSLPQNAKYRKSKP